MVRGRFTLPEMLYILELLMLLINNEIQCVVIMSTLDSQVQSGKPRSPSWVICDPYNEQINPLYLFYIDKDVITINMFS